MENVNVKMDFSKQLIIVGLFLIALKIKFFQSIYVNVKVDMFVKVVYAF